MAEERARKSGRLDDTLGGNGAAGPDPASAFDMELDEGVEDAMGEWFSMVERLVVAPAGRLRLRRAPQISEGDFVVEGEALAEVLTPAGERLVIGSPCDGRVMGFLLHDGFPVRAMEPLLWLEPTRPPVAFTALDPNGRRDCQQLPGDETRLRCSRR
jgi:hypothetical protein